MGILQALGTFSLDTIQALGYTGLFLLMVAESMILPVPSEAVLPFAGFLASDGRMSLALAFAVSLAGTLVGSLLSYGMGAYGVRPLLERYGKYVLVTPHHIETTHAFFERKGGSLTVFLARFVPVVRHLISIPAGSARMPLGRFLLATALGGGLWDAFLLYVGYLLGKNWETVTALVDQWKWAILGAAVIAAAIAAWIAWQRRKRNGTATSSGETGLAPDR
jgi:membrane protein DedA with SNARE-associated domain